MSIAESFYPVQSKYTRHSPPNTLSPLLRLRLNLHRRYEVSAYEFEKFAVSVITATENSVWLPLLLGVGGKSQLPLKIEEALFLDLELKLPTEF